MNVFDKYARSVMPNVAQIHAIMGCNKFQDNVFRLPGFYDDHPVMVYSAACSEDDMVCMDIHVYLFDSADTARDCFQQLLLSQVSEKTP
jgi:hypothetical protein